MSNEEFYNEISSAIVDLDEEKAVKYANKAIQDNLNLLDVVEKGFAAGIRKVGELWEEGEFFLPELMRGAEIMQKFWADNNISCTIYFDPEHDNLKNAIAMSIPFSKSMSFIEKKDMGNYEQLPYESIDYEEYTKRMENINI